MDLQALGDLIGLVLGAASLVVAVVGIRLVVRGLRRRKVTDTEPAQARVVVHGHSPIREPGRGLGNALKRAGMVGAGSAMLGAALWCLRWIILGVWADHMTMLDSGTKGRILRLRGKAQLPEVVAGRDWSDDAAPAVDSVPAEERRVLAAAWLASAQMEHASVAAFAQLSLHLAALGAPAELVERTHRAALDEIRHARRCFALAGAFAGHTRSAGAIAALATPSERAVIDHVRLAIGSLIDGCLAEGIAADVARNGARGARDPVIAETLATIATDEERHAELAWSVLAWCLEVGGAPVRGAVAARATRLSDELAPPAPDFSGIEDLAAHGLFDQRTLGAIATRRIAAVQARALELVTPLARAA
jgi:hypothetical protein